MEISPSTTKKKKSFETEAKKIQIELEKRLEINSDPTAFLEWFNKGALKVKVIKKKNQLDL